MNINYMIDLMHPSYTIDLGFTAETFAAEAKAVTYRDIRLPEEHGALGVYDVRMGDPAAKLPHELVFHPDGFPEGSRVGKTVLIDPTGGGVMVFNTCTGGLIEQGYLSTMPILAATWQLALEAVSRLPTEG
jgi:hypothetical protein